MTELSREEFVKFTKWLNEQTKECCHNCYIDCPAYVDGAYGSVCVLSETSNYIENECL